MIITWTTFSDTQESTVEYGNGQLDRNASGTSTLFVDGGSEQRKLFIHRVELTNLKPKTTYSEF